jgi:molybdopterin-containing oxidoreductase family iron-sulfur binding subunit
MSNGRHGTSDAATRGPHPALPDQWQSIDQWMNTPQFRAMMQNEFPEDAGEWLDPVSRRQMLGLMGASVALATGCNPSLKPASAKMVLPYVTQPSGLLPGLPLFFATAMAQAGGVGIGLIAKSTEGRPIKLEGNPSHPSSLGGTDSTAQAAVLGLYDPDRSSGVLHNGMGSTYDNAVKAIRDALDRQKGRQGEGVRLVTGPITSPTEVRVLGEFLKQFPKAKWLQYEPLAADAVGAAHRQAFGKPVNPVYDFAKPDVVVSLDCDFLGDGLPGAIRYARDFVSRRKVRTVKAGLDAGDGVAPGRMNRLYAVESMVTCTGGVADHRLPLKPSEVEGFARALAARLGLAAPGGVAAGAAGPFLDAVVADLKAAGTKALVVAGDTQPAAVHLLAMAINDALKSEAVRYTEPLQPNGGATVAAIKELAADLKAGTVDVLYLAGVNPAYDAPADLDFKAALSRFKGLGVHHGLYVDETGVLCDWHLPATHFLETWGDVRGHDGTVALQQPLIAPLHGGRSLIELFSTLTGQPVVDPLEVVKATWKAHFHAVVKGPEFEVWWDKSVREGVVEQTAAKPAGVSGVNVGTLAAFGTTPGQLEVQFRPDPMLYDGRYANNGWLQELPKPVVKLAWDNAAILSANTAAKLGLYETGWFTGDTGNSYGWTGGEHGRTEAPMAEFEVNGRKLKAAVFILPGHADDAVTLYLGHGRDRAGKVGSPGGVGTGFNAYLLRTSDTLWTAAGLTVKPTGDVYPLACTQGQYAMEGRRPVRTATREQYAKNEAFAQIPAATPGEFRELRELTPGTPEDFRRLGKAHPFAGGHHHDHDHGHDHAHDGHDHDHGHKPHDPRVIPLSLYPEYPQKVKGEEASKTYRRWGLAIDLNACTGCTTCVAACVAENNIPVVGKDQVTKGRAMHWIRIDRYFSIPGADEGEDQLGDRSVRGRERAEQVKRTADIRVNFMPVMCVHCEKAPCEVVCPVGATLHDADGLNAMVYNRCVGTRYCSNNCPYKVRRFNFLQYTDYTTPALKLVNNPEVTVRTRGVMEKCTYCVQRIRNAEMQAEREHATRPTDAVGRPKIFDGEIVTACQQACPTGAIAFGDINDPTSTVLRWKAEPTTYGLLAELNVMPRTTHIAQVRNESPALARTSKGGA